MNKVLKRILIVSSLVIVILVICFGITNVAYLLLYRKTREFVLLYEKAKMILEKRFRRSKTHEE